jgi:hypothetical protein
MRDTPVTAIQTLHANHPNVFVSWWFVFGMRRHRSNVLKVVSSRMDGLNSEANREILERHENFLFTP